MLEAHVIDGVPEEDEPAVHYPRSLQLLKSCWKFMGLLFNESFVQSLRDIVEAIVEAVDTHGPMDTPDSAWRVAAQGAFPLGGAHGEHCGSTLLWKVRMGYPAIHCSHGTMRPSPLISHQTFTPSFCRSRAEGTF